MADTNFPMPGDRVKVFDHWLYKDDRETPLSVTVKEATVIRRYGKRSEYSGHIYPDLVDVEFDHRPGEESRGHFTSGVEKL
jgi:hypothetical protein